MRLLEVRELGASETSVSILSFLRSRIYIFITKLNIIITFAFELY